MASPEEECVVHVILDEKEPTNKFTEKRWLTVQTTAQEWMKLEGPQADVSKLNKDLFSQEFNNIDDRVRFHPRCYIKFTNKKDIGLARIRSQKMEVKTGQTSAKTTERKLRSKSSNKLPASSSDPSNTSTSTGSSTSMSTTVKRKSSSVLPDQCIICKKKKKMVTSKNKRIVDKLMQAETLTAGKLLDAATSKADEDILVHIRDKDCVAIEVKYHKSCYAKYTKVEYKVPGERQEQEYMVSYKRFCDEIIRKRIIADQEIMRMSKVVQLFIKVVLSVEKVSLTHYRSSLLKYHLQKDFPELQFHAPFRRNQSELVYTESASGVGALDQIPSSSGTESESESSENSSKSSLPGATIEIDTQDDLQKTGTLYNAAIILKSALNDTPGLQTPWPPTSEDFTLKSAKSIIPIELYNFMAWTLGESEEPVLTDFVPTTTETDIKIISVISDIIYLFSKGRKLTPKSLALGLTTRHLTGSTQLLEILSKFGHCASRRSILNYESALAQLQIKIGHDIPPGFSKGSNTVLVWDNIDFGEETVSGKGTTHHTNGILVQKCKTEESRSVDVSVKKNIPFEALPSPDVGHFVLRKREGPVGLSENLKLDKQNYFKNLNDPIKKDLIYCLLKWNDNSNSIPGWTGFQCTVINEEPLPKSGIHYLPVIEASPTDMSTVQTILKHSLEIADKFSLHHITLVFDQAIYAKAQQIRWKDKLFTDRIVIRLGDFHTCMSFCSILGKRFRDAGLLDVLIESEVVASGSIETVLNGHHYNRSVRAHKLMFEALQILRFEAFLSTLEQPTKDRYFEIISNLNASYEVEKCEDIFNSPDLSDVLAAYYDYIEQQSKQDPTFSFWNSYINLVQLLLTFIRATRESNWNLHLSSIRSMMPWFFAYDRTNYARYLPAYWLEMINLPNSHPDVADLTTRGNWTVQRSSYPFSSIACDQAIEQTLNRDSKTKGGLIGKTLNRNATQRWILAQPERAAITRKCEEMIGSVLIAGSKKALSKSLTIRDNTSVNNIMSTISSMINPFQHHHNNLISISSGAISSTDIQCDLLEAEDKGEIELMTYMQDRMIGDKKDVFAPIKQLKLKTFTDIKKSKSIKTKSGQSVVMQSDRKLFARLLICAQSRQIDLKELFTYSLGTVSFPLANNNGSITKTNKSAMLDVIEKKVDDCYVGSVPNGGAIIIDGMAIIQGRSGNLPTTFGELADSLLADIVGLMKYNKCARVDFVVDTYPDISIKNAERSRRALDGAEIIHIYSPSQKTPKQWKKFLSHGKNKERLTEFLFECWTSAIFDKLDVNFELYVCHGQLCHYLKIDSGKVVRNRPALELSSNHEEADTRLILHAMHAGKTFNDVIIYSPDTDVVIISLGVMCSETVNLYFLTGVKNRRRIINLSKIISELGAHVCKALIGLHIFTGCDSTSAFFGKGKRKAFEIMINSDDFISAFNDLGMSLELENTVPKIFEKFVCKLYGQNLNNVNEARYKIFCMTSPSEQSLPPTNDALTQHYKRCNFQALIHRKACEQFIEIASPSGHGWDINDGELSIVWMTKSAAPDAILETINCSCKSGKCSGRCSCHSAKLSCTDMCKCKACNNRVSTEREQNFEINAHNEELYDEDDDEEFEEF